MKSDPRSGAALVLSVLLLAAITVLVGFGRLAMYRNQVKLRLDREREIQQELATRSSMRWLQTMGASEELPSEKVPFLYKTSRGNMSVTLIPAEPVFPRSAVAGDFDIGTSGRNELPFGDYVNTTGGSIPIAKTDKGLVAQLSDRDNNNEIGSFHGLSIDIADSRAPALWTDSDYGLRYLVYLTDFCRADDGVHDSDILRYALTPFGASFRASSGTLPSPYAIWVEQDVPKEASGTTARLSLYVKSPELSEPLKLDSVMLDSRDGSKGFQIAASKVMLIQQDVASNTGTIRRTRTYTVRDLEETVVTGFVNAFSQKCFAAGGIRLTAEVEVRRPRDPEHDDDYHTYVSKIAVTPAYEYSTAVAWKERDGSTTEEISTVIRCNPSIRGMDDVTETGTVTYDTHGTYANRKNHLGDLTR